MSNQDHSDHTAHSGQQTKTEEPEQQDAHSDHSGHDEHSGHSGHGGHASHAAKFKRLFWINLIIAVPTVAQAVCGPVIILLEPNFATYAIPANVLATPALAPAALCSVLAAVLSTWWPGGAAALATCSGWASSWIAGVATFFANLPGAYPQWPAGGKGAVLLAVLSAALVLIVLATPYVRHAVLSVFQARTRPWLRSGSSFGRQSWDS